MTRYYFYCFLLFTSINVFSQQSYHLVYENSRRSYTAKDSFAWKANYYVDFYHLFVEDSASVGFFSNTRRKLNPNLKKYLHNCIFSERNSGKVLDGVSGLYGYQDCYIERNIEYKVPVIDTVNKIFKGIRCREGYVVMAPGDTIFALLAIEYPYPYGPLGFNYFPFLALEQYRTLADSHFIMMEFSEWTGGPLRKHKIPIYTREEYNNKFH